MSTEADPRTAGPTAVPETMLAALLDAPGAPESFRVDEHPVPATINSEYLVHVHATSVNPIETKTRAGRGVSAVIPHFPAVLGNDFSGTIARAPFLAAPLQPGDEVYGMTLSPRYSGSYAEYVPVPSVLIARKPRSLSHTEAAAVPLAALTAWGIVTELADVRPGMRVLVHAGAGGVGHFAVQFAALRGAEVIATAGPSNQSFLRELGAATAIDYRSERFEDTAHDVDVVIDLIGNVHDDTGRRSLQTMRPGGLLINVPTGSWPDFAAEAAAAGMRATDSKITADARALDEITALIDSGRLLVHVDRVLPLVEIGEAHRLSEEGHIRGKIAVSVP